MFKDAGLGLRIYCDMDSQSLRVQVNQNPLPGWKPIWSEVAAFKTPEDWENSEYSKQVTDEQLSDEIIWFWIDLRAKAQ